jgi:hypothetical protein
LTVGLTAPLLTGCTLLAVATLLLESTSYCWCAAVENEVSLTEMQVQMLGQCCAVVLLLQSSSSL